MRGRSSSLPNVADFLYPPPDEQEDVVSGGGGGGGGGEILPPPPHARPRSSQGTMSPPKASIKGGRGLLTVVDFRGKKAMKKQDLASTTQAGRKRIQRQFSNMIKVTSMDDKHFAKPLFKDPDNTYFVMQYLEDHQSLAELLSSRYFLKPESRKYIANSLLHIVDKLHKAGYAHGDIKPENIMVRVRYLGDKDREKVDSVKLIDIESLLSGDETAPPLVTSGTIDFFPPEMKQRSPGDPPLTFENYMAYDLWAVGNILLSFTFKEYQFPFLSPKMPNPNLILKAQQRLSESGFPSSLLHLNLRHRLMHSMPSKQKKRSMSF